MPNCRQLAWVADFSLFESPRNIFRKVGGNFQTFFFQCAVSRESRGNGETVSWIWSQCVQWAESMLSAQPGQLLGFGNCRQLACVADFSNNLKVPSSNPLAEKSPVQVAAISEPDIFKINPFPGGVENIRGNTSKYWNFQKRWGKWSVNIQNINKYNFCNIWSQKMAFWTPKNDFRYSPTWNRVKFLTKQTAAQQLCWQAADSSV